MAAGVKNASFSFDSVNAGAGASPSRDQPVGGQFLIGRTKIVFRETPNAATCGGIGRSQVSRRRSRPGSSKTPTGVRTECRAVALSDPGKRLPLVGALRLWVDSALWQKRVRETDRVRASGNPRVGRRSGPNLGIAEQSATGTWPYNAHLVEKGNSLTELADHSRETPLASRNFPLEARPPETFLRTPF
jgi:hypothetical protein